MTNEQKMKVFNALCIEEFVKIGKKKVFENSVWTFDCAKAWKTEEGLTRTTDFETWCKDKIYDIPDCMSMEMFKTIFYQELKDLYFKECGKVVEELRKVDEAE